MRGVDIWPASDREYRPKSDVEQEFLYLWPLVVNKLPKSVSVTITS